MVRYCIEECRRADWGLPHMHKNVCKKDKRKCNIDGFSG